MRFVILLNKINQNDRSNSARLSKIDKLQHIVRILLIRSK